MGEYEEQEIREPHSGGEIRIRSLVGDGIWSCYIKLGQLRTADAKEDSKKRPRGGREEPIRA